MKLELYDYQQTAVQSTIEYWANGGGRPLIVIPTGGGKSLVMASLFERLFKDYSGTRILCLTHKQELVEQDAAELQEMWPEAPIGIYSAGLGRKDGGAPILFGGVQSVVKSIEAVGERHVVFIDEAHLLSRKDDGQYQQVLRALEAQVPGMRVGGATATEYRTDSGLLTEGWRGTPPLFDEIVFQIDPLTLIKRGILSPLVPYAPHTRLSVDGVNKRGGEYVEKELQAAVDKLDLNEAAVSEIVMAGADRTGWMVFSAGVEHAEHLRDIIRARGISCEMILGDTPKKERRDILERFKRREFQCIVGNKVLTTGFNAKHIDLLADLAPTASKGLHVQKMGRGTRLFAGKADCLVLDFAGNTMRHGHLDMIDGSKQDGGPGEAPAKECDGCGMINHVSAKECKGCGRPFPIIETQKFSSKSSGAPIFSNQNEPIWHDVHSIIARKHSPKPKYDAQGNELPSFPSLRLDYFNGLTTVSHYCTLEHETAGGMARRWWERNSVSGVAPRTVDEALERIEDLRVPGRVLTMKDGKWVRITTWDYSIPSEKVVTVQKMIEPPVRKPSLRTVSFNASDFS